ncbi:hypothetical protein ASF72_10565 [Arthrobacter sp. Leaf141]|nr:hypothetical protein ASF72_10565 [Arthrobacter sp. Leaf141]
MKYSTLTFSQPLAVSGKEADRTEISITPSQYVVWEDTGQPIEDFTDTVSAPAGEQGEVTAPFVDQEGFRNRMGELVTGFAYKVVRRSWYGDQIRTAWRTWAPLIGQETVDFDTLPADEPTEPYTVQAPEVLSVAGATGAVGVDFLAERLTPWVDARIEAGSNLDDLIPVVSASVRDPGSDLRSAVDARAAAAASPKLDKTVAATTYAAKGVETSKLDKTEAAASYAAKSVETSKLDAGQKGAASGVAPLDAGQRVPQANLPEALAPGALSATILDRTEKVSLLVTDYGAKGDGTTNDKAAIQEAIDKAATFGLQARFPKGRYLVNGSINLPAGADVLGDPGSEILAASGAYSSGGGVLFASGSDGAKVALAADASEGAQTITLPAAISATVQAGDVIGFESNLPAFASNMYAGEMHKVLSVTGNVAVMDTGLTLPYLVADSAKVWKISTVDHVRIRGMRITAATPTTILGARGIVVRKATDVRVEDCTIQNAAGGVFFADVLDGFIDGTLVDRAPNLQNFQGYGVTAAGNTANLIVSRLIARYCRHAFTTLGGNGNDAETGATYGGPRNVLVVDSIGEGGVDTYSIFDTHPQGINIVFENCLATGGTGSNANGFQVRARNVTLRNCRSWKVGARSVNASSSQGCIIEGGEYAYGGLSTGVGGLALGVNARVRGAEIHHNAGAGIGDGPGSFIGWCSIYENTYGIHDQTDGSSGSVYVNNYIPKSTTQNLSVLSPKGTTLIARNIMPGYGLGSDGVGGTVGANVVRAGNHTDGNMGNYAQLSLDPGNASQALALMLKFGGVEALRIRRGTAADDAVLAIAAGRKLQVTGGTVELLSTIFKLTATTDLQFPTTPAAPVAGTAGAIPGAPFAWADIIINGVAGQIPFWRKA